MHVPSKSLCLSHFCFRMVATGIVYVATDCYTCIIAHFSTKYSLYRVENGERSQVILIWYCIQKEFNFVLLYRSLNFFLKDIFWPLCCLFFFDIRILITSLVSFGHCVVCSSSIYGFWLPLWYLLNIVLSVLLRYTDSDYLFGIFWPLCCLFFFDIRILITSLVSFDHCVVCSSSIYGFWLPPFGIFWPLCCLFFFDIRILITSMVSSNSSSKTFQPPLWGSSWSDGSWIYNYLCNQCLLPLRLWVRIPLMARCTTLCDKVCQWLATGRWFSLGTPFAPPTKVTATI
jgi:hypothetical protein